VPELETFVSSTIESLWIPSQDESIHRIESTLFSDARPADVITPLQSLLAGTIREYETWSQDDMAYISTPRIRPYLQYLLGLAYELSGDEANAVHTYWQVWHDYPNNPYALMARHKLEPIEP
jgi:hypothetical protein